MSEFDSTEEWRDIPGCAGYQVSDLGRVRSCRRGGRGANLLPGCWHILKPTSLPSGYLYVSLLPTGDKKASRRYVHRVVLEAFIGPAPDRAQARHVNDPDRSNNRLANLAWGTAQENADDVLRHGNRRLGERTSWATLIDEQASTILRRVAAGERQCDLAREFNQTRENVFKLVTGRTWGHIAPDVSRRIAERTGPDVETMERCIRELIVGEDRRWPLSDGDIVRALREVGIDVAKPTVRAHRIALGFPAISARRLG